jgi:hypothetical protein
LLTQVLNTRTSWRASFIDKDCSISFGLESLYAKKAFQQEL